MKARVPWLTLLLVVANLAMAFVVAFRPELMLEFGFVADQPSLRSAMTHSFVHQNVLHLLGNMLFLAAVGSYVEQAARPWKMAIVYLGGGWAGALVHWLLFRGAGGVGALVGASGSIAACIGFGAVRFWSSRIPVLGKLTAPAWTVAALWLLLQVVGMFVKIGDARGGTAFGAHLGGLVFGLLMSVALGASTDADRDFGHQQISEMEERSPAAKKLAAQQALARHPDDSRALTQLADACRQLGDKEEEVKALLHLLDVGLPPDNSRAVLRLEELYLLTTIDSRRRMRLTTDVNMDAALALLRSVATQKDDPERPQALLELASRKVPGTWAEHLLEDYPMDAATEIARARGLL